MKNNKFLSFLVALSMASTFGIATMTAHAAAPAFSFEVSEDSGDDDDHVLKVIDVYYEGYEGYNYSGARFNFKMPSSLAHDDCETCVVWSEGGNRNVSTTDVDADYADDGAITITTMTMKESGVDLKGGAICTIFIQVPADAVKFDLELTDCSFSYYDGGIKNGDGAAMLANTETVIAIPGEEPADDTELPPFDGVLTATAIEGLFDDDTSTVPVKAWMTDAVDWSSYDAVKDLNWIITVNGVEQAPVAATSETEITGGMTVIYGLAIAGRVDQLETIESVVLK